MRAVDVIIKKRDGEALSQAEIDWFVNGFTRGDIPDYQVAAWAMAVVLNGMTDQETTDLTQAMARSGEMLDLSAIAPVVVDMGALYAHMEETGLPALRSDEAGAPAPGEEPLLRFENCIECGLCISACPVAATAAFYQGPAALAAACRLVEEPRGCSSADALRRVSAEHGVWRCHSAYECSQVCPNHVDPAGAIMKLRRTLLFRLF